ncbi:MAG: hypothetical protein GXP45_03980 [bacterium]|nr:hypothetical protein [bacterium]
MDQTKISQDLERALKEEGFTDTKVEADQNAEMTDLTIKTNIKDDSKVQALSQAIQKFLIEDKYVSNADEILNQAVT